MTRTLKITLCALGILLASACTSNSTQKPESYGSAPAAATPVVAASGPAGVAVAQNPLGQILTDAHGRALYLFEGDTGTTSTCVGECASHWPPLTTVGAPTAGTGVDAALLNASPRPDGTLQVTYNGHPLYYYDDDHDPGTTKGQGESAFGAKWYVLTPAGAKIDQD